MKNTLEYKGYHTNVQYSVEDQVLYGKIEGIVDLVTFESETASDIEREFHNAVDDYLAFCEEVGKDPEKSYTGTFNVRVRPALHKQAVTYAIVNGMSLNGVVELAINEFLHTKTV